MPLVKPAASRRPRPAAERRGSGLESCYSGNTAAAECATLPPSDAGPGESVAGLRTALAQAQDVLAYKDREVRQLQEELTRRRERLEADFVADTQAALRDTQHRLSQALEDRDRLEAQLHQNRRGLDERDGTIVALQSSLTELRAEHAHVLEMKAAGRDQHIAQLQSRLAQQQDRIQALEHSLDRHGVLAEESEAMIAELTARLQAAQAHDGEAEQRDRALEELQRQLSESTGQVAHLKKALAKAQRAADQLQGTVDAHEETIARMERDRRGFQEDVDQFRTEMAALREALQERTHRLEKYEVVIASLERELEEVERREAEARRSIQNRVPASPMPQKAVRSGEDVGALTALVEEQRHTIGLLRQQLDTVVMTGRLPDGQWLGRAEEEAHDLKQIIHSNNEQREVLARTYEGLQGELERLRLELRSRTADLEHLARQRQVEMQELVRKQDLALEQQRTVTLRHAAEVEAARAEARRFEDLLLAEKAQRQETQLDRQQDVQGLLELLKQKDDALAELQRGPKPSAELKAKEEEAVLLTAINKELRQRLELYERNGARNSELQRRVKDLERQLSQARADAREEHREDLALLRNEVDRLTASCAEKECRLQALRRQGPAEEAALEVQRLKATVQTQERLIARLQKGPPGAPTAA
eukprot:EG_transcript_4702